MEGVGIEDVEIIEAGAAVAAAKHVDVGADDGGCMGAEGRMAFA